MTMLILGVLAALVVGAVLLFRAVERSEPHIHIDKTRAMMKWDH